MTNNNILNNLKDRHVAITDGVFAIAMTILVLEIAVPTISEISSGVALNEYFMTYLLPSILIYFISFYIVYNFWENTTLLFQFKKIKDSILTLNMLTMASVCLIPFATGFLFKFYNYTNVNIFFSLLVLIISLLYILMFMLLVRDNFKKYFEKKDEIKATVNETYYDGVELPNLKLTLFYILMTPVLSSVISLILAFFSPLASILSFVLILILRFVIRMRRTSKDKLNDLELTDDEKELLENIRESIYGNDS